jgi:hypothetical protein
VTEEGDLSTRVQAALQGMGAIVVRINSGQIPASGGYLHLAKKGTPDLFCGFQGAQVFLELKTDVGKLNPAQVKWHAVAKSHGLTVVTVRSVEAAVRAVLEARRKS